MFRVQAMTLKAFDRCDQAVIVRIVPNLTELGLVKFLRGNWRQAAEINAVYKAVLS